MSADWLAKGQTAPFALLFTLPADTVAGSYTARVSGEMNSGLAPSSPDLTPQNNTVVFSLTVPAA